jgi:hypothetical protein
VVAVGNFKLSADRGQRRTADPFALSFTDMWTGPSLDGGHGAMWADVDDDGLPDLYLPLISSGPSQFEISGVR